MHPNFAYSQDSGWRDTLAIAPVRTPGDHAVTRERGRYSATNATRTLRGRMASAPVPCRTTMPKTAYTHRRRRVRQRQAVLQPEGGRRPADGSRPFDGSDSVAARRRSGQRLRSEVRQATHSRLCGTGRETGDRPHRTPGRRALPEARASRRTGYRKRTDQGSKRQGRPRKRGGPVRGGDVSPRASPSRTGFPAQPLSRP